VDALVARTRPARLAQVHPGAEHGTGVGQDDDAHDVVREGGVQVGGELAAQLRGERVAVARRVQRDRRRAARDLEVHQFVHGRHCDTRRDRSHGAGAPTRPVRTVGPVTEAPTTVWHAWRRHVDLCRTSAAICRS
jgi:hypothetical protein